MNFKDYLTPSRKGSALFKQHLAIEFGYDWQRPSQLHKAIDDFRNAVKGAFHIGSGGQHYMMNAIVTDTPSPSPRMINASEKGDDFLDEQIAAITDVLQFAGSDIADFVRYSLDELHICDTQKDIAGLGCSCGIYGKKPHEGGHVTVMTTCEFAVSAAEGIIHELGHHRLHALHIHLMTSPDQLIGNDDDDVFDSPVRFDIQRPMAACLHAEYSYAVVTHFYTEVIAAMISHDITELHGASLREICSRQAYNIKRIGNGIHLMRKHFLAGSNAAFKDALTDYVEQEYHRARTQIKMVAPDTDWLPNAGDV